MLVYFYLITVVFSVFVVYIISISFIKRFQQDRIEVVAKLSGFDECKHLFSLFIKICFPFVNMIYDIYLLGFHNQIYQKMITQLFLEGRAIFKKNL